VKSVEVFKTLNPRGGLIAFNMGISGALCTTIPAPADTVLFYETEAWSDGRRAVAFCDGHAKLVSSDAWAILAKHLQPSGIKRVPKPLPLNYGLNWDPKRPYQPVQVQAIPATPPRAGKGKQ
jgi:prepilin-type processing-associated H-X9-DG protein